MKKPKILCLDIETAPALAYVWKLFDETIGLNQIVRPGRIMCWGAKFFGKPGVHFEDERPKDGETEEESRRRMMSRLHALLSEADAVVTYNGDKFDLPKINGAFLDAGLNPVGPIPSIDLIKTVRKLGLQSSRLEFVAPFLKIGAKVQSGGFQLWKDCLDGDAAAWKKMRRYNEQDVRLLEKLYSKLGPFIKNHPALFKTSGKKLPFGCPFCGAQHLQSRGYRVTASYRIERFQCLECGRWPDGKKSKIK